MKRRPRRAGTSFPFWLPARVAAAGVALLSVVLVAGLGCAENALGPVIRGHASVVDGDGLEIGGTKIRLFGIDAPETAQRCGRGDGTHWPCGQYATVALDRLVAGKEVACEVRDRDQYDRPVAVCRAGSLDVGADQVRHGWAVAYRRFSKDYVDEESSAKTEAAGVWQGRFEEPEQWRRRQRERREH